MTFTRGAWRARDYSLAARFDPRSNAIGLLRLVFAASVVVSHAWPLGGFGADPGRPGMNLGILAVDGFFALSGFLIAASAARSSVPRFMWHRVLRILPGFWVALIAITVVFVPVATGRLAGGSWSFLVHNLGLRIGQPGIAGTLPNNPHPDLWTGPMYTLAIEFACYLIIAAMSAMRLLKPGPLGVAVVLGWSWLWVLVTAAPGVDYRLGRFPLAFLVGALLWALQRRIPTGLSATAAAASVVVSTYLIGDYRLFAIIGVPAFAYLCIYAGAVLPWRGVGSRRDLSYGIYLYGWPVMQVLTAWGLQRFGVGLYLAVALTGTLGFAAASWYLVESRSLRLKGSFSGGIERDPVEVRERRVCGVSAHSAVRVDADAPVASGIDGRGHNRERLCPDWPVTDREYEKDRRAAAALDQAPQVNDPV